MNKNVGLIKTVSSELLSACYTQEDIWTDRSDFSSRMSVGSKYLQSLLTVSETSCESVSVRVFVWVCNEAAETNCSAIGCFSHTQCESRLCGYREEHQLSTLHSAAATEQGRTATDSRTANFTLIHFTLRLQLDNHETCVFYRQGDEL